MLSSTREGISQSQKMGEKLLHKDRIHAQKTHDDEDEDEDEGVPVRLQISSTSHQKTLHPDIKYRVKYREYLLQMPEFHTRCIFHSFRLTVLTFTSWLSHPKFLNIKLVTIVVWEQNSTSVETVVLMPSGCFLHNIVTWTEVFTAFLALICFLIMNLLFVYFWWPKFWLCFQGFTQRLTNSPA